jgi:hypothetical protein
MRTPSRTLITVAVATGWVVMVVTLGGLAWHKGTRGDSTDDGLRDPLLRAEAEDDDLPGSQPSRVEPNGPPPATDVMKQPARLPLPKLPVILPDDLPLPTVPEVPRADPP